MRTAERDFLLFPLAVAAGSADGWSYTSLGHAFVANMTGNTVLAGLAVFGRGELLHPLLSIFCYSLGVALATLVVREVPDGAPWARSVSFMLLLEALLMALAESAWMAFQGPPLHSDPPIELLLATVAFAVGLQSGAMIQLKVPGIVTTYITGTWTTLISGIVRFRTREQRSSRRERLEFEERLFLQGGFLATYFLAAVLTGGLHRFLPGAVGWVPACSAGLAAVYGFARA